MFELCHNELSSIQTFFPKHPLLRPNRVGAPPIPTSKRMKKKRIKALFYCHIKTHV